MRPEATLYPQVTIEETLSSSRCCVNRDVTAGLDWPCGCCMLLLPYWQYPEGLECLRNGDYDDGQGAKDGTPAFTCCAALRGGSLASLW